MSGLLRQEDYFFIHIYLVIPVRNLAGNLLGDLFVLEDSKSSIFGLFGVMLLLDEIIRKELSDPHSLITRPRLVHTWPWHRG